MTLQSTKAALRQNFKVSSTFQINWPGKQNMMDSN